MPTIAFIESNTTGTGRILAQKALARGYRVCFLSENPERYPYVRELMLHPRGVNTSDPQEVLRCLQKQEDLVAVLSTSEYYLETAALAAQTLGLPGADPDAIAACRNKWRARTLLQEAGVATPRSRRVTSMEEARQEWQEQGGPVVVKPVSGSGSFGVRLHREQQSYEEHIATLLAVTENERGLPLEPGALVQEFLDGPEYSIEMFGTKDGLQLLGITAKHLGPAPYFLEVGHDFPAPLAAEPARRIAETTKAALSAVGMDFGPTHTEIRLRDGEPVLIEINPRLAGGMIPVLIDRATGADVLEALLDLYLGHSISYEPWKKQTASIAFLIPDQPGRLVEISRPSLDPQTDAEIFIKAQAGDELTLEGNFRDRIGHVITYGDTAEESRASAIEIRDSINLRIAPTESHKTELHQTVSRQTPTTGENTGRLRRTLHPEAMAIIRKAPTPARRRWELEQLAAIDEAHLLMLQEEELLPAESVRKLLTTIRQMNDAGFPDIAESVAPRGTYLLYEGALIDQLGVELGGITHLGRSRNDINACLFRLRLRKPFENVYRSLWRLRSTLVRRAAQFTELAMPIYSQFQPGLPGTLASYLLGVERALVRDQEALKQLLNNLNTCPMGAGAGGGSTFPIRPQRTAELLGFNQTCRSALDAVASRDLALRLLSTVAICGMNISRLAQDFQLWTTREHALLSLPDELAGGSSMMPQKKNPYLLEMIKGRAGRATGYWSNAISTMQKTPFSNSVEVGTEALVGLEDGLREFEEAARLMALIVQGAEPDATSMERSLNDGVVIAAAVADSIVRTTGAPFRQAHHQVGAAVAEALAQGTSPKTAVEELISEDNRPATSLEWAQLYEYGGGPGTDSTHRALIAADHELDTDADWLRACLDHWSVAGTHRLKAIDHLMEHAP